MGPAGSSMIDLRASRCASSIAGSGARTSTSMATPRRWSTYFNADWNGATSSDTRTLDACALASALRDVTARIVSSGRAAARPDTAPTAPSAIP